LSFFPKTLPKGLRLEFQESIVLRCLLAVFLVSICHGVPARTFSIPVVVEGLDTDIVFTDGFETDLIPPPVVSSVDYPVIAHGGKLILTGINFTGASSVSIGGVTHSDLSVADDTSLTVNDISDTVPTGVQDLVVSADGGSSAAFELTVIHLLISEVEVDSPGSDNHEFIELSTGVTAATSLDGYVVVLFNGGSTNGDRYQIFDLADGGTTTSDGLMLIGGDVLSNPAQLVQNSGDFIQQGEDAVAIYQFPADSASFPVNYATIGNSGLIDALVYETGADADAPQLYPLLSAGGVIDEGASSSARETASIQRCDLDDVRRDSTTYKREVPTPGLINLPCTGPVALPTCSIEFSTCPNTGAGQCGALFVDHSGVGQCHIIGVPRCYGTSTSFHTLAADSRIDIFLMGKLDNLQTFLAPYLGDSAKMQFYDIDGNEVGTRIEVDVDCNVGEPPASNVGDLGSGAVRRIEVTGNADIWIDDFQVNP